MSLRIKQIKACIFSCMRFLAVASFLTLPSALISQPATGTPLPSTGQYSRLVRLAHGTHNGTIVASNGQTGNIFQSTDNGVTFTQLATISGPSGATLNGAGTLFEMPQNVGSLATGTLLYATTYTEGSQRAIEMYISTNAGSTWTYWEQLKIGGSSTTRLWEPQFEIANDGALVVFWSDETDPCCSQKIAQMRTYNGASWQNQQNTVASTSQADRPGTVVVTKLPSGSYFMTYEICGPAACTVYYRTSTDGWNWGTVSNLGTRLATPYGQYFEHTPTNTWSPSVLSTNGAILVIGQVFLASNNTVDSQNGMVILENLSSDGNSGIWVPVSAPVQVPQAYDNYCPNYSSALLPAADGSSILEMTSAYNSSGGCEAYYASETWNNLPVDGSTQRLHQYGIQRPLRR